jgi:hypothetical protein
MNNIFRKINKVIRFGEYSNAINFDNNFSGIGFCSEKTRAIRQYQSNYILGIWLSQEKTSF